MGDASSQFNSEPLRDSLVSESFRKTFALDTETPTGKVMLPPNPGFLFFVTQDLTGVITRTYNQVGVPDSNGDPTFFPNARLRIGNDRQFRDIRIVYESAGIQETTNPITYADLVHLRNKGEGRLLVEVSFSRNGLSVDYEERGVVSVFINNNDPKNSETAYLSPEEIDEIKAGKVITSKDRPGFINGIRYRTKGLKGFELNFTPHGSDFPKEVFIPDYLCSEDVDDIVIPPSIRADSINAFVGDDESWRRFS